MEKSSIRTLKAKDIDSVYKIYAVEQWNDRKNDIQRMFSYEPEGCFVAEIDGKIAGHIFSVRYGKFGWIGLLIVKAEHRRKGIGTSLTKKTMDYLLNHEIKTIKLDGVPDVSDLYRKLRFVDEYDSLRFKATNKQATSLKNSSVAPLEKEMMTKIAAFDSEYFGGDRSRVLKKLFEENTRRCFVSYAESEVAGYIMSRRLEKGYRIGPWVCDPKNQQTATDLLTNCMEALGHDTAIYVGVPAINKLAVELLRESGFEQYSKSIRMRYGKKLENDRAEGIFGIGGPEKG